ncbi:dynactin subunit 2-like [Gymnogyps californianus]|uniref:dynactin subunit 2-like n=1 Tax=Gymnogyps californianus TaxID=33616 RepID=UPI0021CA9354|nr:dynactin subunit 2-like [Gymnogyps californianus]
MYPQGDSFELDSCRCAHSAIPVKRRQNLSQRDNIFFQAWNEPEVYESSDVSEDDQAEFELELEELTSSSVEHLTIDWNATYEKFKDKQLSTEGVDSSDNISKPRTTGYKSGECEILGEGLGAKETPQQRYQRLQHEVQELFREVEQIQLTWGLEDDSSEIINGHMYNLGTSVRCAENGGGPIAFMGFPFEGYAKYAGVSLEVESEHARSQLLPAVAHFHPAWRTSLPSLSSFHGAHACLGKSPAKAPVPTGDAVTFELYWKPEQEQFAQTAKIAELEKRLAQLEATVRCEPESQHPLSVGLKGTSLMETLQLVQAKVNVLDVAVLDQVEARLQSVLAKVNEIAKHKATVQDADTQSKIHQIYETMQRWDPVASTLPDVVQRLVTLRDLHEQATQFGQVLVHLDTTQQEAAGALKDNSVLLAELQKTMKENLAIVEENSAEIDARIKRLQK